MTNWMFSFVMICWSLQFTRDLSFHLSLDGDIPGCFSIWRSLGRNLSAAFWIHCTWHWRSTVMNFYTKTVQQQWQMNVLLCLCWSLQFTNRPFVFWSFHGRWYLGHCAGFLNASHSARTLVLFSGSSALDIEVDSYELIIWHQSQCCNNDNWMLFFVFLDLHNCHRPSYLWSIFVNSSWVHV